MSEAAEKVGSLKTIAVFPLPLVLLPGEVLPLHIFEPRYRQMLTDIENERNLFGISLFDSAEGKSDRPDVGSVGCVAELREVQPLPDGRSNILTQGIIRYSIVDYIDAGTPYLTAEVRFFEDDEGDSAVVESTSDEVFDLFERVAKAAFDLSGNRGKLPEIQKSDPERLSFVVTAAFNLDNEIKYDLLKTTSTLERFGRLKTILESAVGRMEESAAIHKVAQTNGHTKKKIDL
jgi:ATP-dependent Lon protease